MAGNPIWQAGWLNSAKQLPSPNFNARPLGCDTDLIVIHSISLPPGQYGGRYVQSLFCNSLDIQVHPYFQTLVNLKVSSHFFIDRIGVVWQFVSIDERAWHAGVSIFQSRVDCNNYSVGIELEGLEGELFEAAQYVSLSKVCKLIKNILPIRHVIGHEHIASGRKNDPGAGFNWKQLQKNTSWPTWCFPALEFDLKH